MQSKLIYFDTKTNSIKGTKRSLLALPIIILTYIAWLYLSQHDISWYRFLLPILLLVSALGVEIPTSRNSSIIYGALVGFVIFGTLSSLYSINFGRALAEILVGTGFCALTSLFIFSIY